MVAVNVQALPAVEPVRHLAPGMLEGGEVNAFTRINELIMLMKKLNIEMRDALRSFHDDMQKVAFENQVMSMGTKKEAISKTFDAAIMSSWGKIGAGIVGVFGAGLGNKTANASWTTGATAFGNVNQGIMDNVAAHSTREAQQLQLQGEFQATTADNLAKSLATAAERAADASRQLREATRELLALYERLANAVQLRGR